MEIQAQGKPCCLPSPPSSATVLSDASPPPLTQLLHQLLVLVEFLQSLYVHVRDVNGLGFIAVLLIPQQAHRELGPGGGLQPADRTRVTPRCRTTHQSDPITVTPYRSASPPSSTAPHLPSRAGRWGQRRGFARTSPHVLRPRVGVRPAAPPGEGRPELPGAFSTAWAKRPARQRGLRAEGWVGARVWRT